MYTGETTNVHPNTLRSLKRRGLVNSVNQLTLEGVKVVAPNAKIKASPDRQTARRVQDELIGIIIDQGWSLTERISRNMPPDVTGASLCHSVYPEWVGEFRFIISKLSPKTKPTP